ncbi:hypothetical protein M8J76_004068 [Diaphorina citri]|nr:hypothetical protein M8J76_004068 [Diaphorina citri]
MPKCFLESNGDNDDDFRESPVESNDDLTKYTYWYLLPVTKYSYWYMLLQILLDYSCSGMPGDIVATGK